MFGIEQRINEKNSWAVLFPWNLRFSMNIFQKFLRASRAEQLGERKKVLPTSQSVSEDTFTAQKAATQFQVV